MQRLVHGDVLPMAMSAFKAANPGAVLEDFVAWLRNHQDPTETMSCTSLGEGRMPAQGDQGQGGGGRRGQEHPLGVLAKGNPHGNTASNNSNTSNTSNSWRQGGAGADGNSGSGGADPVARLKAMLDQCSSRPYAEQTPAGVECVDGVGAPADERGVDGVAAGVDGSGDGAYDAAGLQGVPEAWQSTWAAAAAVPAWEQKPLQVRGCGRC